MDLMFLKMFLIIKYFIQSIIINRNVIYFVKKINTFGCIVKMNTITSINSDAEICKIIAK